MAALNPTEYAWIIPATSQFLDADGKPFVGGYCVLYINGTTGAPYTSYQNWEGVENPVEIPIDILGHAPAIGSVNYAYDLYVYDSLGSLVYSRLNLGAYGDGGEFTIHTDNTIHGDGSVSNPLGVEKSQVINGLMRGIVPESDNVHVRTYQYLQDGSITVGLRVDAPEPYQAGYGIKIEDNTISLDSDTDFDGAIFIGQGSGSVVSDLNTLVTETSREGESIFLHNGTIYFKKGVFHVDAFARFSATPDASEYNLDFRGPNNARVSYTFDNTYSHTECILISFEVTVTSDGTALSLYLDPASAPASYNLNLQAINIARLMNSAIVGGGSGASYTPGPGIKIRDDEISVNFNQVQMKLTPVTENIFIDQDGNISFEQIRSDWNESDPESQAYIRNKPQGLVDDPYYVHTDNNYTTADKNKLAGIESGAQVNVNADWNASSGDAEILNKPTLATVATSGSYNDLTDKPTIPSITYTTSQEVTDILADLT